MLSLKKVVKFIHKEKSDFWEVLSEVEKLEIEKGLDQLNNNERLNFLEVFKHIS